MAVTISGLNRQLNELKRRQQEEQAAHRENVRRLERQFDEQIARLSRERDEMIRQAQTSAREEYQQTLLQLLDEIERITSERLQRLEEEYRRHEELTRELNEQMRAENERIKVQLQQYINDSEALDGRAQALAAECIEEAETAQQSVQQRPVRRFFGGKLDEYASLLRQARENFCSGLYQAAAAMASSARAATEGISADLDLQIEEWMRHFNVWRALVENAELALENGARKPVGIDSEGVELSEAEWDYWGRGEYSGLKKLVADHRRAIAEVEAMGAEAYMNQENALTADEVRARVSDARGFGQSINEMFGGAGAECVYSDMRLTAAGKITAELREAGYISIDPSNTGFAPPDRLTAGTAWYRAFWDERVSKPINDYYGETVSPLEYYQLSFTYRGGDTLRMRIIPKRTDGRIVANVCLLEVISDAPAGSITVQLLMKANAERIRTATGGMTVLGVGSQKELETQTATLSRFAAKKTRLAVQP